MAKVFLFLLFVAVLLLGCTHQEAGKVSAQAAGGWLEEMKEAFGYSEDKEGPVLGDVGEAVVMGVYLVIGGLLALYVRFLYRCCNASVSGADSVARIFPLLTMVTIGVIAVVKSSLALSLGLVGALSIVRFRAAIKDPEELVYLFLCIGIGLALGAKQLLLAVAMVGVATVFVVGIHFTTGKSRRQTLLLTITGDSKKHFGEDAAGVLPVVEELVGSYTLQRFDLEQERGQVRIVISRRGGRETAALIARLRERLPECEFSYVNLESTF